MDEGLKQRLVGAAVLVFVAVVIIPIVLDEPREQEQGIAIVNIPPEPSENLGSRVAALPEVEPLQAEGGLREEIAEELRAFEPVVNAAPEPAASAEPLQEELPEEAKEADAEDASRPLRDSSAARAAALEGHSEAVSVSGWVVQLASFKQPANADALQKRLRTRDYPVFLDSVAGTKGTITRVYVGPFPEQADARAVASRLRQETRLEGMVVALGDR